MTDHDTCPECGINSFTAAKVVDLRVDRDAGAA